MSLEQYTSEQLQSELNRRDDCYLSDLAKFEETMILLWYWSRAWHRQAGGYTASDTGNLISRASKYIRQMIDRNPRLEHFRSYTRSNRLSVEPHEETFDESVRLQKAISGLLLNDATVAHVARFTMESPEQAVYAMTKYGPSIAAKVNEVAIQMEVTGKDRREGYPPESEDGRSRRLGNLFGFLTSGGEA